MQKKVILFYVLAVVFTTIKAQQLPIAWEELTSPEFVKGVEKADGVCIVPMGVIEKHGAHLPLATDVILAREISRQAAEIEYCIVFPDFYVGQIFEAKHQPGTVAYSTSLILKMLDETCQEIARNGMKKIILVNTHGGSDALVSFFCQIQLESPRDYAVFSFSPREDEETRKKIDTLRKSTSEGHADEIETSEMLAIYPGLTRMSEVNTESGKDLRRLSLQHLNTGISWYSRYPNHYAGEASGATAELGKISLDSRVRQLSEVIKMVKEDKMTIQLQNHFFQESTSPLETLPLK